MKVLDADLEQIKNIFTVPHNYHKSFWRIKLFLQYHFYATQLKLSYLSYGKILFWNIFVIL
jgi:hypothetical protein